VQARVKRERCVLAVCEHAVAMLPFACRLADLTLRHLKVAVAVLEAMRAGDVLHTKEA
jgi:hypothetical protein